MTCGRPINRELPKVLSEVWKTETRSRCVHIYGLIDVKKADAAEAMLLRFKNIKTDKHFEKKLQNADNTIIFCSPEVRAFNYNVLQSTF